MKKNVNSKNVLSQYQSLLLSIGQLLKFCFRMPSFANVVEDVIENTLMNILLEAANGEVNITARPRLIALPPRKGTPPHKHWSSNPWLLTSRDEWNEQWSFYKKSLYLNIIFICIFILEATVILAWLQFWALPWTRPLKTLLWLFYFPVNVTYCVYIYICSLWQIPYIE